MTPSTISVRVRMTLLLAVTVLVLTTVLYFVQRSLSDQLDLLVRERVTETERVLGRVLDLRASGAAIHADDYTRWDDFVAFVRKPDPKWGQLYLTESIGTFSLDIAWVLDARFHLLYTANPNGVAALSPLPAPLPTLATQLGESPIRHFYARTPRGLLEVWTSSIQPSSDFTRSAPPAGYYIVGRLWTPQRITKLSSYLEGTVAVREGDATPAGAIASRETGQIRISTPLEDILGRPIAALVYTTVYPVAPRVHAALHIVMVVIMGGALVLFAGVSLALTRWVAKPLAVITSSLRAEDPSPLQRLMARHDEFGGLARLVRDFFAQRESLIEARQAAEVAARAKEQFLANISHELRTPMHGILSYSRFGVNDAQTAAREELLEYFQEITDCGTTLLTLVDELLDLAKYDAGRMKLDAVEIPIEEAAQEAVDELAALYQERGLALDVRVEPDLAPVVADRLKIRQVLRNLLSNAAKFTPEGGQVTIRAERSGRFARVMVEDTGAGIPASELESVFDRFSQASTTRSGSGGTGLGLPLCREIVKAHGGRIWAERRVPNGTRMVFEIPFAGPESAGGDGADPDSNDLGPGREAA
ncbi:MAG TPA: ATP-binding protein [Candidatus Eisenbacteria bacterium]